MAQLMPNGFEEYEIRYSREQEELYVSHVGLPGADPTLGLLATCLFRVKDDRYLVDAGDIFGLKVFSVDAYEYLLLKLSDLQPATLTVMLAELGDQQRLGALLEFASKD